MECRAYRELLPRYLAGDLPREAFDLMVEHEAACPVCAQLTAEKMPATAATPAAPTPWLAETLERTVGQDCDYIAIRLAAMLDGPPEPDIAALINRHLAQCQACRELAAVVGDLPDFYAAYPRLTADSGFVREVMAQTHGLRKTRRVRFMDVMRVLWRSPAMIMESAAVFALLLTPLVGEPVAKTLEAVRGAGQGIEERIDTMDPRAKAYQELSAIGTDVVALGNAPIEAAGNRFDQAQAWIQSNLEQATSVDASTSVPAAIVRSWAQRALGRIGLMEVPAGREESAAPAPTDTEQPPPSGPDPGEADNQ